MNLLLAVPHRSKAERHMSDTAGALKICQTWGVLRKPGTDVAAKDGPRERPRNRPIRCADPSKRCDLLRTCHASGVESACGGYGRVRDV